MPLQAKESRTLPTWCLWAGAVFAVLRAFAPALPADAGAPWRPVVQSHRSRIGELAAGKFLVASRNLPDPNFSETVVLLADYSKQAAMGLVINRQSEIPMSQVFRNLTGAKGRSDAVHLGGPVAPTGVVALLRSANDVVDGRRIFGDVHLIVARERLEATIASRAEPNVFRVYLGYAGWGAGQLDLETSHGAWHVLPGNADLVFDPDPESIWPRQIRWTDRIMALWEPNGPQSYQVER